MQPRESTSQSTPRLSVVVPCFNEEEVVSAFVERMAAAARAAAADSYEMLLVDDGSSDATWSLICGLARDDPHVVGVRLSRNHGHQLALTAGLSLCKGARVLVIDADLQDPPELLSDMMALMDGGAEVVFGQRIERDGETAFKKLAAHIFYRVLNALSDVEIPRDTGDFRLISRKVLDLLNEMPERHRFLRGMVAWIGLKQVALPYRRQSRQAGVTKYPLRKMLLFAADALTAFSVRPLRVASYLGAACALFGLLAFGYTLYSWLMLSTVPGWSSVMVVILVLGSCQLLMMGIIGEYLGRMFMEAKSRPLFLVSEVVGRESAEDEEPKP